MFDPLPPETFALKVLLADLHDDLERRVERLRLLIAIESDFGGGRGLLLPGGMPAQFAYVETRQAFVAGNFLAVILLSQCVLENVLAAQIGLESLSREIKGASTIGRKPRPTFRETIAACRSANVLDEKDDIDLARLSDLRNALTHFRDVNDKSHLDRRALNQRRPAADVCEDDARFAITLFVRILARPQFRFAMNEAGSV
jgi:hypothetical protein